jgi:hypothetical protein
MLDNVNSETIREYILQIMGLDLKGTMALNTFDDTQEFAICQYDVGKTTLTWSDGQYRFSPVYLL